MKYETFMKPRGRFIRRDNALRTYGSAVCRASAFADISMHGRERWYRHKSRRKAYAQASVAQSIPRARLSSTTPFLSSASLFLTTSIVVEPRLSCETRFIIPRAATHPPGIFQKQYCADVIASSSKINYHWE